MIYASKENSKIKEIRKLNLKKYRDLTGMFLVEGDHLVREAYQKGVLHTLIVLEDTYHYSVETLVVTKEVMSSLSEIPSTPRVMGVCIKKEKKENYGNSILLLDGIQDPGNLGTIIRSAAAFSLDTIVLGKDTVDIYHPKVIRASEGMLFHVSFMTLDLKEAIKELKNKGYEILGTKVDGGMILEKYPIKEKYALVMGNEGSGVKEEILKLCDDYLYIPMNPVCESLNVGVATSIILYEFEKRK